jgi:hypothetical protein
MTANGRHAVRLRVVLQPPLGNAGAGRLPGRRIEEDHAADVARQARRFSTLDCRPMVSQRCLIVPADSSMARIPLPCAIIAAELRATSSMRRLAPGEDGLRIDAFPASYSTLRRNDITSRKRIFFAGRPS